MAAKKSGGGKKYAPKVSGMWRLSLIVYAIVCFRLLEFAGIRTFEFVRTIRDAWGVKDYNLNFALLGVSCAGLIILLFSNAKKALLNMLGAGMLMVPLWLNTEEFTGSIGARAATFGSIDPVAVVLSLSACMWCICMLHGADVKLQLITGAVLIGANVWLCFMPNFPIDWWQLVTIGAFAILAGLCMDLAYNGFNVSSLLPPGAMFVQLMLKYSSLGSVTTGLATAAVCGVCLIALAMSPKLRKGSAGTAITLCGVAANALSLLYLNGMLI